MCSTGSPLGGNTRNTILCVSKLVTHIAGSVRTYGTKQSLLGTEIYRTHISSGSGHPCPACLPASGHREEIAQTPSHKHLNIHTSQPPKLQSKETFVKESSAQTVPEETPAM